MFCRQKVPGSSSARKETADKNTLIKHENLERKIELCKPNLIQKRIVIVASYHFLLDQTNLLSHQ